MLATNQAFLHTPPKKKKHEKSKDNYEELVNNGSVTHTGQKFKTFKS